MANPGSILGQIGESIEQIGKDVAQEAVQAPKDIAGKALESLGVSSGGKKNPKQQSQNTPQIPGQEEGIQAPASGQSEEVKSAIARKALEEISGKTSQQKEPTVWEKLQEEEKQKKEAEKKQKAEAQKQALPKSGGKRPRGDLYGMKAKKSSTEMSRNVRQD